MRVVRQPDGARAPLDEGTVEDVVGPADGADGWAVTVRVGAELWLLPEGDLEPESPGSVGGTERNDTLLLRLVTDLTDGIHAARVAEQIDGVLRTIVGPSILEIEAERHWAEPFQYELEVNLRPLGDAVEAFRAIAAAGGDWLSCRDDGWRCSLWWSADEDDAGFLVPEVRGAEVTLFPWSNPARRPEHERPLVSV